MKYNISMLQKPLTKLFGQGRLLEISKGEVIIQPGKKPDGVYYIEEGYIKSYGYISSGSTNIFLIRQPGEMFPLMWAFKGEQTDVYYSSMTNAKLRIISKSEFSDYLKNNPKDNELIIDNILTLYKRRVTKVEILEHRLALHRIVALLIHLEEDFGERKLLQRLIPIPIRHQDIADSTNMSRETASRELAKLQKDGHIFYQDGRIGIKSLKKLKALLD